MGHYRGMLGNVFVSTDVLMVAVFLGYAALSGKKEPTPCEDWLDGLITWHIGNIDTDNVELGRQPEIVVDDILTLRPLRKVVFTVDSWDFVPVLDFTDTGFDTILTINNQQAIDSFDSHGFVFHILRPICT